MLALFALVFIGECLWSYTQTSATFDEPVHLADGYFSLARGDYRFDPEHPPLLRMWAAVPLLFERVTADSTVLDATWSDSWALNVLHHDAHRFVYLQNDADRLLYRARFMIVLLGVLLGVLVFAWVHEWLGFRAACAALVMLALEPNIVAHYSLVTTDAGLTTFAVGALYFAWRLCRRSTPLNVAGLCVFCALAVTSKFSGVLLFPIVAGLLALAVYPFRRLSAKTAVVVALLMVVSSYAFIWTTYRFHYLPSANSTWTYALHENPSLRELAPQLAATVKWIDSHRLLPNVFSEGFFIGQAKAQRRVAFLGGRYSDTGWWYYFPYAMAIKTPVSLLALSFGGLVYLLGRPRDRTMLACVLITIAGFLVPLMVSHLNIGLRHALAVYPFLILLAALAVDTLRTRGVAGMAAVAVLAGFWLFEVGRVYPHALAFFNTLVGGPVHGAEYLVDSNLDWGQDLKGLKKWMDEQHIPEISLSYFGSADPAYYGMKVNYLHGSPFFVTPEQTGQPKVPGYLAVSETNMKGLYFGNNPRDYFSRPLAPLTPVAVIGHSIRVYRLPGGP